VLIGAGLAGRLARRTSPAQATRGVRRVGTLLTVAIPAIAMVALSECIGLYPATALYLAFYMRWIGQHR
jgi:hypothetical protein